MNKNVLHLFCLLVFQVNLMANDVLSRRIDVAFQQMPLQTALDEVARVARFEWSYNPKIIERNRVVTLLANDWTVREVLYELLGQNYAFKTNGNYLIIKKINNESGEMIGYIRDPLTGKRVANATVYDRRTLRATTTDSTGFYTLKVKKKSELVVARLGYRDTVFEVIPNSTRYVSVGLQTSPQAPVLLGKQESVRKEMQKVTYDLEQFFHATLNKWHNQNVSNSLHRMFQISLLPTLGTNHVLSGKVANDFSINLLAGSSKSVRYAELGGLGNFTKKTVQGFQAAGVFNIVRGNVDAIQLAGVYNQSLDSLSGMQGSGVLNVALHTQGFATQMAGVMNYAGSGRSGAMQISGGLNVADKSSVLQAAAFVNRAKTMDGLQIAACVNSADTVSGVQGSGMLGQATEVRGLQGAALVSVSKKTSGVQASGLVGVSRVANGIQAAGLVGVGQEANGLQVASILCVNHEVNGLQTAGFVNVSREMNGIQAAGLINVSREVNGIQMSSLVNVSKRTRGLQIGLVNSSKKLRGVQLGLINRAGRLWLPLINVRFQRMKE